MFRCMWYLMFICIVLFFVIFFWYFLFLVMEKGFLEEWGKRIGGSIICEGISGVMLW